MTCPHLNCLVYHKNGVCNCHMERYCKVCSQCKQPLAPGHVCGGYLGFKQGYSPNGNVKLSASANGDSLGDYKQSLIQWLKGEKKHCISCDNNPRKHPKKWSIEYGVLFIGDRRCSHCSCKHPTLDNVLLCCVCGKAREVEVEQ